MRAVWLAANFIHRPLEGAFERGLCAKVATHAVDAAAGWCGAGADVDAFVGGIVGDKLDGRARVELPEVLDAAVDVSADVVGIVMLVFGCRDDLMGEDALAETGGESFDLRDDTLGHIDG